MKKIMTFEILETDRTLETAKLKFVKSEKTGEFVAFVNHKMGCFIGVPENAPCGKRICVLSKELKGAVTKNVLYECELRPMVGNKKGYVVVSAQPVLFEAVIETILVPRRPFIRYAYRSAIKPSISILRTAARLPAVL